MNETERQFSASQTPRSMYPSIYLCKAGVPTRDIVYIYCPVIRSVLEYACPVWHPSLTSKLAKDIGRVQKRCLRIIFPQCCHILKPSLDKSGLNRLDTSREEITKQIFRQIKSYSPTALLNPTLKSFQFSDDIKT